MASDATIRQMARGRVRTITEQISLIYDLQAGSSGTSLVRCGDLPSIRLRGILRILFVAFTALLFCDFNGCHRPPSKPVRTWFEVPIYSGPGAPAPGGRVVAVTLNPADDKTAIAATHSGGLFRTTDSGLSWQHLDGIEPNRFWDVQIDPSNPQTVIATVVVDTHDPGQQGVWLSRDGGQTWSMQLANPRECQNGTKPVYGRWINFGPGQHIFVGTDCGLAVSHDRGSTWSMITPGGASPSVAGVISRAGPNFSTDPNSVIVDICGESGPFRSTDAGATFNTGATGASFPIGFCSLAPSPDDRSVIFAASNSGPVGILWESDDGGTTWDQLFSSNNPGRHPWVRTSRTPAIAAPNFNLFFHAGADVFQVSCDSSRTGNRCPVPTSGANPFTSPPHDYGGMAFSSNGCPRYMGNDHGVIASADCGQTWNYVHNGLRSLSIYSMAGTVLPDHVDLYFATQDNFIWSSANSGSTWQSVPGLPEGLDLQAPQSESQHGLSLVTGTYCAFPCQRMMWRDHLTSGINWPLSSDQNVPSQNGNPPFIIPGSTAAPSFAEVEGSNLWIRPPNGVWRQVTLAQPLPALVPATQLFISGPETDPTVYAVSQRTNNTHGLVRMTGINQPNATVTEVGSQLGDVYFWAPDDNPWRTPFVVGVSPQDGRFAMVGDRVRGAVLTTTDGGSTWFADSNLNKLVVDNGALQFHSPFHGLQAHVIKYNPARGGHILVGTEASGAIETCDNGFTWHRVNGSRRAKAISDFFFDGLNRSVYVATYGSGLWRIDYPRPRVGPDPCWDPIPPITLPSGKLAFSIATSPAGDPAEVMVRLNGNPWAGPLGGGYVASPRPLSPGMYQLQVSLLPQYPLPLYDIVLGGSCQPNGTVNLISGATANCTILIRHH